jgi:hypothetical protein
MKLAGTPLADESHDKTVASNRQIVDRSCELKRKACAA